MSTLLQFSVFVTALFCVIITTVSAMIKRLMFRVFQMVSQQRTLMLVQVSFELCLYLETCCWPWTKHCRERPASRARASLCLSWCRPGSNAVVRSTFIGDGCQNEELEEYYPGLLCWYDMRPSASNHPSDRTSPQAWPLLNCRVLLSSVGIPKEDILACNTTREYTND